MATFFEGICIEEVDDVNRGELRDTRSWFTRGAYWDILYFDPEINIVSFMVHIIKR